MTARTRSPHERIPPDQWRRVWVLAAAFALCTFLFLEIILRAKGFEPAVVDDVELWSVIRDDIPANDPDCVVQIGSSRMQCAINLYEFEARYGKLPYSLALIRGNSFPMLADLAEDETFTGTLICEISPFIFFYDKSFYTHRPELIALDTYKRMKSSLFALHERRLEAEVRSHLVFLHSRLTVDKYFRALYKGYLDLGGTRLTKHRNRTYDTTNVRGGFVEDKVYPTDIPKEVERTPQQQKIFDKTVEYVRMIEARGGRVIFAFFPCRGTSRIIELTKYPRQTYWDDLLEATACIGIHWEDDPELAQYKPRVDWSHLDYRDAREFTKHFVRILKEEETKRAE